ncbi:MAG: succinylglutamate desuccinylase/aspartoacylase family protein [Gammaproteobacteria bacterium]|nr:succinylglutamate desuccinylase/aspartoacylase family protein [Gammaproteobacteria bacterium]
MAGQEGRTRRPKASDLFINGATVSPGTRRTLELPIPHLYTHTEMAMVVHVIRGRQDGPRLFVSAALHGDELLGIEVVRRLVRHRAMERMRGTLLAVPIVNPYGVLAQSRYLPDRRDLNRSFPGTTRGSLAARLAHLFMTEIVSNATHGIDLHTGAQHRFNLPQIRADLTDKENLELARAFDVPVVLDANIRDGSLRAAVSESGLPMLVYEAGEALRYDEISVRVGVQGVLGVMRKLGMLRPSRSSKKKREPYVSRSSRWVRAPKGGVLLSIKPLGSKVSEGDTLAVVADPYGESQEPIVADFPGIVIGCTHLPLVHEGDAVLHVAKFSDAEEVAEYVDTFQAEYLEQDD